MCDFTKIILVHETDFPFNFIRHKMSITLDTMTTTPFAIEDENFSTATSDEDLIPKQDDPSGKVEAVNTQPAVSTEKVQLPLTRTSPDILSTMLGAMRGSFWFSFASMAVTMLKSTGMFLFNNSDDIGKASVMNVSETWMKLQHHLLVTEFGGRLISQNFRNVMCTRDPWIATKKTIFDIIRMHMLTVTELFFQSSERHRLSLNSINWNEMEVYASLSDKKIDGIPTTIRWDIVKKEPGCPTLMKDVPYILITSSPSGILPHLYCKKPNVATVNVVPPNTLSTTSIPLTMNSPVSAPKDDVVAPDPQNNMNEPSSAILCKKKRKANA